MTARSIPAPSGSPYRIVMVCLGNICRSPTAEVVLSEMLGAADLDDVEVTSCGTGDWHVGGPMDERAAKVLSAAGYDPSRHRARQLSADWFDDDLILAMDRSNYDDILAALPPERHDHVRLFRSFDPEAPGEAEPEVPDPYAGGPQGFLDVLDIVERTSRNLLAQLRNALSGG